MKNVVNTIRVTLSKILQGVIGLILSMVLYISYNYYSDSFLKLIPLIGICFIARSWHVCNVKRTIAEEIQEEEYNNQEKKVS